MIFTPGYAPLWVHALTDNISLLIAVFLYSLLYMKSKKSSLDARHISSQETFFKIKLNELQTEKLLILLGAGLGALIGSRLIASLEFPDLFFNPPTWLYYYSAKSVAGGLAGGIIGVEIIKKIRGIKNSVGDIMVGPIAVGIIIGRIGCFLIGVRDNTVGLPTNSIFGMDQGDGLLRHPTSLYEIFAVIILSSVVYFIFKNREKISNHISSFENVSKIGSGLYFRIFCFGYFLFRFFVEFIKPIHPIFGSLSAIQWVSLLIVGIYGYTLIRLFIDMKMNPDKA